MRFVYERQTKSYDVYKEVGGINRLYIDPASKLGKEFSIQFVQSEAPKS